MRRLAGVLLTLLGGCGDGQFHTLLKQRVAEPACVDCAFPREPIVVALPADIGDRFGAPGTGAASGGPCLLEPQMGSLFPKNWLRPRFRWNPPVAATAFELRLHVDVEPNELVVYTSESSWTMDQATWSSLLRRAAGHPISVTMRSLDLSGSSSEPALGTSGSITIAPVPAPGSIVYWSVKGETGETFLKAFEVGGEQLLTLVRPAATRCVGCHSSTPDGEYVAFSDADTPTEQGQYASLLLRSARDGNAEPPWLSASARALLARRNQHLAAFSPAHFRQGDRVAISLYNRQLVWTDLEATSLDEGVATGVLAVPGDVGAMPAWPSWSHDGNFIVYASGQGTLFGGLLSSADIYRVPYAERQGGTAVPIAGASEPAFNEFYPTLSPDDQLLAFSRVGVDEGDSYSNRRAEIFVVPAAGGEPNRIVANDPGACFALSSPGVTNSWPKWSPEATVTGGKTYYWLTFSSTRAGGLPQLYVTPVVRTGESELTTYPALYLWNQVPTEGNHTPAWDSFQLPLSAP